MKREENGGDAAESTICVAGQRGENRQSRISQRAVTGTGIATDGTDSIFPPHPNGEDKMVEAPGVVTALLQLMKNAREGV